MIESEIRQLPVYSGEKLVGIVTNEDIIHGAVIGKWGNTKVEEVMTKEPFSFKDVEIDEIQRGFIMDDFESFARKY